MRRRLRKVPRISISIVALQAALPPGRISCPYGDNARFGAWALASALSHCRIHLLSCVIVGNLVILSPAGGQDQLFIGVRVRITQDNASKGRARAGHRAKALFSDEETEARKARNLTLGRTLEDTAVVSTRGSVSFLT